MTLGRVRTVPGEAVPGKGRSKLRPCIVLSAIYVPSLFTLFFIHGPAVRAVSPPGFHFGPRHASANLPRRNALPSMFVSVNCVDVKSFVV